ncbi:MAG: hypothetical protein QM451_01575, partial [Bacillota bacterium]|nr:hypothetical protein [Bacillota bacterium]
DSQRFAGIRSCRTFLFLRTPPPSYGTSLIAINELLLQVINASTVALHYTGLEMRFLDLCGFPDPMTSTTVKDGLDK